MNSNANKIQSSTLAKSLPLISTLLLVSLMALVMYSVISVLASERKDQLYPKAQNAIIELSQIDFSSSASLPLDGQWSFYWDELLSYSQIQERTKNANSKVIKVPSVWLDLVDESNDITKHGHATYKLRVNTKAKDKRLALRIPSIGSAYRVYIDDKLLSVGGRVGDSQESAIPFYKVGIFPFEVPNDSFDIVIQVSNYDMIWGGIWESIRIASPEQLHIEQSRKNFRSAFIIGIFVTIAVFNLIQFSLRTVDFSPLVTSIVCILLAIREVEQSQLFAFLEIFYFDYNSSIRISFITFYLAAAFIISYFYLTFRAEYHRKVIITILSVAFLLTVHALLVTPRSFSFLMPYYQFLAIGYIIYASYGLVLAVIRKRTNANFIFLGTLVLFLLIANDILISLRIIDGVILVSFGLVALIMCQNYATYSQFILAAEQKKQLSEELSLRNAELEEFSKSLEELVASRTTELSSANEQLEILAFNDPLTNVLNRRGLLQFIGQAKVNFEETGTPFCLLLIDFDHFKKLNDTLGHEVGDIVLVQGSEKMKAVVREQDYVGRWGGEEFLILLNKTNISEAQDIANGIRVVIADLLTQRIESTVTISIGVSEFKAEESIEKSINRADEALYSAKNNGRNRVELAS